MLKETLKNKKKKTKMVKKSWKLIHMKRLVNCLFKWERLAC